MNFLKKSLSLKVFLPPAGVLSYHMIVYWQIQASCHNIYSFFISIRLEKVFTMTHTFFLAYAGG